MEILTSVKRLYISFKSLVNDSVYSFGRAALLLLVEVYNHTVPVRKRGRIRVNTKTITGETIFCVGLGTGFLNFILYFLLFTILFYISLYDGIKEKKTM